MSVINIGRHTLTLSDGRDAYAQLRRKYVHRAHSERAALLTHFSSSFADADELFRRFPNHLEGTVKRVTEAALTDIAAYGIYDVDERIFGKRFAAHLAAHESQFNELYEQYQAIALSAVELQAYREERAANRAQIIGGGFGVEGAARGMVLGAVANVALGVAHGVTNAVGSAISTAAGKRKKAELYNAPTTRNRLAGLVFDTVTLAHLPVVEIINERQGVAKFDSVSEQDQSKAAALVNSILKNRVPADAQAEVLVQALALDPFGKQPWFEWLSRFGDQDGSVTSAAEHVGIVELPDAKAKLIADKLLGLPIETPEDCEAAIASLEQYAASLYTNIEAERQDLKQRAQQLEIEKRSFKGETFVTQQEADERREAEMDRIAAEMSTADLVIVRKGDRLVIMNGDPVTDPADPHPSLSERQKQDLATLFKSEVGKRWTSGERWLVVGLGLAGLCLLGVGGLGLVPLGIAAFMWHRANSQHGDTVRTEYPEIFGPPNLRT